MKPVVVYYSPSCAFSAATVSFLLLRGADARLVNVEANLEEKRRAEAAVAGKFETPTLHIAEGWHVAPSLSDLKKLLEQAGLPDEHAPHTRLKKVG